MDSTWPSAQAYKKSHLVRRTPAFQSEFKDQHHDCGAMFPGEKSGGFYGNVRGFRGKTSLSLRTTYRTLCALEARFIEDVYSKRERVSNEG